MRVERLENVELSTYGPNKLFNITDKVVELAKGVKFGIIALQAVGSTGALVLLPRKRELVEAFEYNLWDLVPTLGWKHPGNAYAHLRSTLIGTMLALPVIDGNVPLGDTGIFFLENQPASRRHRRIIASLIVSSGTGKVADINSSL
ncbi:MAG: YjbQ family protein [Thermofilaceae archaeon]